MTSIDIDQFVKTQETGIKVEFKKDRSAWKSFHNVP